MSLETLSHSFLSGTRRILQLTRFQSRWQETRLGRIHYFVAAGQGPLPPMLFLHGLGAHAAELAPVFWRLRKYSQAILAVDLPVHGWSDSPREGVTPDNLQDMLHEALDQILAPYPPVLVFGNSLGGYGAIRYTNYRPENVSMLVLSSPGGAPVDLAQLHKLKNIFAEATQERPSEFVARLYNQPPAYRWLLEKEIQVRFSKTELRAIMEQFHPDHLLHPDELHAVHVPTLLIWGQQDRILEEHIHFWRQHLPDRWRLEEPSHFTHCPYMEMSGELALRIRDFARFHRA